MSVVLRAADVPVASRAEYVHEVVGAALGPLDVRTGDGNEVPDQVRVADLCKVDVVAQGEVVLEQDGRQARHRAGDFAFVDLSRPAHWTNAWSTQVVAIAFPRKLL